MEIDIQMTSLETATHEELIAIIKVLIKENALLKERLSKYEISKNSNNSSLNSSN